MFLSRQPFLLTNNACQMTSEVKQNLHVVSYNVYSNSILHKFTFQSSRAKVKVKVTDVKSLL